MKKVFFAFLAIGAMTLASCSNEDMDVKPAGAEGTVTFTASLPASVQSRDYSDGQTAKNLTYAIYEAGQGDAEQTPLITGTATFNNLKATVTTTLATGKTYDIIFWAQADNAPYAFDTAKKTVTATYDGITANNESLDAFFWAEKDLTVTGPVSKTITLTRPFAQVNVGTNDFALAEKAGLTVTQSSLSFSTNVANAINLYSGAVSGEAEVTFGLANIPAGETFPVANYDYLAMAYVLVAAEKQTLDVTLATDGTPNKPVFASVPVQRNYRTNIYGALLTNPAVFNVEINPDYEKPDYKYEVVAKTAEDVVGGFEKGFDITVPENTEIDLSGVPSDKLVADDEMTITIAPDSKLILADDAFITANNGLTLKGGSSATSRSGETIVLANGILTNKADTNPGPGYYKNLIKVYGGELIIENMTLINDPDWHYHGDGVERPFNSAAIMYWNDAKITITNSRVISGEFALCGMGRGGVNTAVVNLKDSYFESTSSNIHNGKNWAYCMRIFGSSATLENCEVKGIQGGFSAEENDNVVIKGSKTKFYTVNTEGKQDAFYPVYVSSSACVTIEDGEFIGANNRSGGVLTEGTSCLVSGDNDNNYPSGNIIIKGGKFSGKAYNHVTKTIYQPESWVALDESEAPLLWTVKAE